MKTVKFSPEFNTFSKSEKKLLEETLPLVERFIKRSPKLSKVRHHTRDAHAKTYAVLEGKLDMKANLPFEVVRLFKGQQYKVTARISNANLHIPRGQDLPAYGFALKIKDVDGCDANFPLANFPVFPTSSVKVFLKFFNRLNRFYVARSRGFFSGILKIPSLFFSGLPFLKAVFSKSVRRNVRKFLQRSRHFILSHPYHSIGVYRFGDEMIKLRLLPLNVPEHFGKRALDQRAAIIEYLKKNTFRAELQVSFCKKLTTHPVNNLLKEWPENSFFTFGTIIFDHASLRNIFSVENENLAFNPFDNAEVLQPAGKIQQLRDEVYQTSAETRRKLNSKISGNSI